MPDRSNSGTEVTLALLFCSCAPEKEDDTIQSARRDI
jgi:hypothetical protein